MRAVLALLLALVLALASQSEAVARAEMAGATGQEVCGAGLMLIDATGKPLGAHPCTHCLAASPAALMLAPPMVTPPSTTGRALDRATKVSGRGRPAPAPAARGPPSFL